MALDPFGNTDFNIPGVNPPDFPPRIDPGSYGGIGNFDFSGTPQLQTALGGGGFGGGGPGGSAGGPTVKFTGTNNPSGTLSGEDNDWRIRVSLAPQSRVFYRSSNPGILSPLIRTSGVIFPYTPQIQMTHNARYSEQKLTHSNYAAYFYEGSDVSAISIQGDFTVQTVDEGRYLLAAVSFLRSATKMFFGNQDESALAGSPPPLLYLNGYGNYYFPNVPCLLTNFQHTLPGDVDYMEVKVPNQSSTQVNPDLYSAAPTWVPLSSSISITLQPVYSRKRVHEDFNLDKLANGTLLSSKGGFI